MNQLNRSPDNPCSGLTNDNGTCSAPVPAGEASARSWGREVAGLMNALQMLQLDGASSVSAGSGCTVFDLSKYFPASSEENSYLLNNTKIAFVLLEFGSQHPFYSQSQISDYAEGIYHQYIGGLSGNKKQEGEKCNYLFSMLLAFKYSGNQKADVNILKELETIDSDFLIRYLRTIELYLSISSHETSRVSYDDVQELYNLVQDTGFFPAVWLLIKLAVNVDNHYLCSPFLISKLLPAYFERRNELTMLMCVFSLNPKDAFIAAVKLDDLKKCRSTESISQRDVFMLILAALLMDDPLVDWKWIDEAVAFPEALARMLLVDWFDILHSRRTRGGKDQVKKLRLQYSYQEMSDAVTEGGKRFVSKREFNSTYKSQQKGHGSSRERRIHYRHFSNTKYVQDSPCLSGILHLTQSHMWKYSSGVDSRPLTSVLYLQNSADTGCFPLLLKDAGDIYLGFGCFAKAREQYQRLHNHPGLSASLKNRLDELIEICELNIPVKPDASEYLADAEQRKDKSKKRHQGKKKASVKNMSPSGQGRSDSVETGAGQKVKPTYIPVVVKEADIDGLKTGGVVQEFTKCMKPDEQLHSVMNESVKTAKERSAISVSKKNTPDHAVSTGFPNVSKQYTFLLKTECFSDHNVEVRQFIREINRYRDDGDLQGEGKCLDKWLKNDRVRGRIYEDAAWFYIRQCMLPVEVEAEMLSHDVSAVSTEDGAPQRKMFHLALGYISGAMTCYLGSPVAKDIKNDSLKELLGRTHQAFPEKKDDFEFCKRLRSGCSGFGHIYSELSDCYTNTKMRNLFAKKGREFFDLKRTADPRYYTWE